MSLSDAVSSLQLSEDYNSKLTLAGDYVKYIVLGSNTQRFRRIHGGRSANRRIFACQTCP